MAKYAFNYDSGEYEYIERDGFSIDRGEYVYNWRGRRGRRASPGRTKNVE